MGIGSFSFFCKFFFEPLNHLKWHINDLKKIAWFVIIKILPKREVAITDFVGEVDYLELER